MPFSGQLVFDRLAAPSLFTDDATQNNSSMSRSVRLHELILPLGIIGCLLVFLVPLPASVMDVLLAANVTISLIVLLTTVYVGTPLEFSLFPTILLATTLSRLVLNVATTRLILSRAGTHGLSAAGDVIQSFGQFVAGDRLVVGLVMFCIIFVIQMVVITKGALRISEVAARFALDGMPGRQLAIDADLAAGTIDQEEARRRRTEVARQADFYGAMDGASKFVRGDAVAGVIITLINIIGGLYIGVVQDGMSVVSATEVFTKLTIGDGLVSQIPALLISLAAGLLVTRSSEPTNLSTEILQQLFASPRVLAVAGSFVALLVITKLPAIPLLMIGGSCIGFAVVAQRGQRKETGKSAAPDKSEKRSKNVRAATESRIEDYLAVDPVEVEVGVGLVRLADPQRGGDLLRRITRVRQALASDLGVVLPKVRVRDNLRLPENAYSIGFSGNSVAQAEVMPNSVIATVVGEHLPQLNGQPFIHPALRQGGIAIDYEQARLAQSAGYRILSSSELIAEHLQQTVRQLAHELLTRDATRHLVDELRKTSPTVVEELIPEVMKLSDVQQVLQSLLREGIPIRQLSRILEALGDFAPKTRNLSELTELVRRRLARTISARYSDNEGRLHVVTLDPRLEHMIAEHPGGDRATGLGTERQKQICRAIESSVELLEQSGRPPIVLTDSATRRAVRTVTQPAIPRLVVLGREEITRETRVLSVDIVEIRGTS